MSAVVHRHTGHRGAGAIKKALAAGPLRPALPRSELEQTFADIVQRAGLPRPLVNHWLDIGGELIQADCAWPEWRLIVEVDSHAWHGAAAAFDRDRRRDRRCLAAGWQVIRVTERALREEGPELERELRALLSPALRRPA